METKTTNTQSHRILGRIEVSPDQILLDQELQEQSLCVPDDLPSNTLRGKIEETLSNGSRENVGVQRIMKLQLSGLTRHEIAKVTGLHVQTVATITQSRLYLVGLRRLQKQERNETLGIIAASASESAILMRDVIRHGSDIKDRLKTATWMLESAGYKGTEKHVHVVTDLAELTEAAYQRAAGERTSRERDEKESGSVKNDFPSFVGGFSSISSNSGSGRNVEIFDAVVGADVFDVDSVKNINEEVE